jgi:2,3-bisphosphoglycerate-independent phosphoglycerate mutase
MSQAKAMLIILDGFGEGEANKNINAIYAAQTPFIDHLKKTYPWSQLEPGGASVGVLPNQTGGSDVGHNTIGTGQVNRQPVKIIHDAIADGSFFKNPELIQAIKQVKKNNSNLHLLGIGADSYIHAYTPFLYALLDLCIKYQLSSDQVFLHLASDGRDNPPKSALKFFSKIEKQCQQKKMGKIASVFGRFYLDRGKNWERTESLYNLLVDESQDYLEDWSQYLQDNYQQNITDEFIKPQSFGNQSGIFPRLNNNDAVINFCYRADRERQITTALTVPEFKEFKRCNPPSNLHYTGFINYDPQLKNTYAAFAEEQAEICLSEIIEQHGLKQMHLAGQEKIIFVTYNLNRCQQLSLTNETDLQAPQTKEVETFDLNPKMSAPNLTKILLDELEQNKNEVYIVNYENCDQVGHTGDFAATIKAVEAVDSSLAQVIPLALEKGFKLIITADHGNADLMKDQTGDPHTAHSANKVPCIYVSTDSNAKIKSGDLSDIAPSFLKLLNIPVPPQMTGKNLII